MNFVVGTQGGETCRGASSVPRWEPKIPEKTHMGTRNGAIIDAVTAPVPLRHNLPLLLLLQLLHQSEIAAPIDQPRAHDPEACDDDEGSRYVFIFEIRLSSKRAGFLETIRK